MQTHNRTQEIIIKEATGEPPKEEVLRQIEELGEGWRIASITTTAETVSDKSSLGGRRYRRYIMTAVVERI